ncbi:microneme protein MIC15 [Besnoitia besnoiti]|uniref:Microneme protein MIC15 n=1 Tax=Besnoitia besnoiti TaxID=94643 RepID=A0A2A9MJV7_BESBE|nr:microneme protein MIC15 [Besnoitia besnoiti]PFH38255.1 microneme protein MIC15 [Besnoitia besnoiti]
MGLLAVDDTINFAAPLHRTRRLFVATMALCKLSFSAVFLAFVVMNGLARQVQLGTTNLMSNKWTTVRFNEPMLKPLVFASPPTLTANNFAMVLIGSVNKSSFEARVYFPRCARLTTSSSESYPVHWLAVEATETGYYDYSTRQHVEWTAREYVISTAGGFAAGDLLSALFSAWQAHWGIPSVVLAVQNQREMMQEFYSEKEYANPVVVHGHNGGILTFSFSRQISYRAYFSVKVGIFLYVPSPHAAISGVNIRARRYDWKENEAAPLPELVMDGSQPSPFVAQWATRSETPLGVLLTQERLADGTNPVSLVAVHDCRNTASREAHEFEVTYAFTAEHVNGGPNCFWPSAKVPPLLTEPCKLACHALWSLYERSVWACQDVNACFEHALRSIKTVEAVREVDPSIAGHIATTCDFEIRDAVIMEQYQYHVKLSADDVAAGTVWSSSSQCSGDKSKVGIVGAFYAKHDVSLMTGSYCEVQDVAHEIRQICQGQQGSGCSLGEPQVTALSVLFTNLCFKPSEAELHLFFSCDYDTMARFECKLYKSQRYNPESGTCSCPSDMTACSLDEAKARDSWFHNLSPSHRYILSGQIRLDPVEKVFQAYNAVDYASNVAGKDLCTMSNTVSVCKNLRPYTATHLNMGADCYKESSKSQYCTMPCLEAWSAFMASEMPLSTHDYLRMFEVFWHSYTFPSLPKGTSSEFLEQIRNCRFSPRPTSAPMDQYEDEISVPVPSSGSISVDINCSNGLRRDVIQALVGPKTLITRNVEVLGCRYEDVTDTVRAACDEARSTGTTACVIDTSLLTPSAILCYSSEVVLAVRSNCVPDPSLKPDFECEPYLVTGRINTNGTACTCPNNADPCTITESRLSDSWWKTLPTGSIVSLANAVIWAAPPGTSLYGFTNTDAHRDICAPDPFHYVLCKDPNCREAFAIDMHASSADDRECQEACAALVVSGCATAQSKWLCVARALSKCYTPNTESMTCQIDMSPYTFSAADGTCRCTGMGSPCTVDEAEVTRPDWIESFQALGVGDREGVVVAKNFRALWIGDPDKWKYEAGVNKGAGCVANPWIAGVFCGVKLAIKPPARGDAAPLCAEAVTDDPAKATSSACRVHCASVFKECKQIVSQGSPIYSVALQCFEAAAAAHPTLMFCSYQIAPEDPDAGKATLDAGWTVATTEWVRVTFGADFSEPPVVIVGVPRTIDPYYKTVIRNVSTTSFEVKLHRDNCTLAKTQSRSAAVSWMALPEGRYLTSNVRNPVKAVKLQLSTFAPTSMSLTFRNLKSPEDIVAVAQIQSVDPATTATEGLGVIVSVVESDHVEISLVANKSVDISSVTVGLLVMGKQDTELAAGLPPLLNRFRLHTFRVRKGAYSASHIFGKDVPFAGPNMPYIFSTTIITRSTDQVFQVSDQVVITRRPTTDPFTWSALLWKAICEPTRHFKAIPDSADLEVVGFYIEANSAEPTPSTPELGDICSLFSAQSFVTTLKQNCVNLCNDGKPSSVVEHCEQKCRPVVDPEGLEACKQGCAENIEDEFQKCASQCQDADSLACITSCEDVMANQCRSASSKDAMNCVLYGLPVTELEACVFNEAYTSDQTPIPELPEAEEDMPNQSYADCFVLDMRQGYDRFIGWDSRTATCKCPNDFAACTSAAVDAGHHWRTELLRPDGLCAAQGDAAFMALAQRFRSTTGNLCELAKIGSRITWEDNTLPAYPDQDVNTEDSVVRSGEYECRNSWFYVFCPADATSTTTVAPTVTKEEITLKTAIVGEWGEWSPCSGTCISSSWTPKRMRKRQVLAQLPTSATPDLWEMEDCLGLPICGTACWDSDWTEWGDCAEYTVDLKAGAELYRRQVKHIFSYSAAACGNDKFVRYEKCEEEMAEVYEDVSAMDTTTSRGAGHHRGVYDGPDGRLPFPASPTRASSSLIPSAEQLSFFVDSADPYAKLTQARMGFMDRRRSRSRSVSVEDGSGAAVAQPEGVKHREPGANRRHSEEPPDGHNEPGRRRGETETNVARPAVGRGGRSQEAPGRVAYQVDSGNNEGLLAAIETVASPDKLHGGGLGAGAASESEKEVDTARSHEELERAAPLVSDERQEDKGESSRNAETEIASHAAAAPWDAGHGNVAMGTELPKGMTEPAPAGEPVEPKKAQASGGPLTAPAADDTVATGSETAAFVGRASRGRKRARTDNSSTRTRRGTRAARAGVVPVCSAVSAWSGCDSPCAIHQGTAARRYRLALPGLNNARYCTLPALDDKHLCPDLQACEYPKIDCSMVTAGRQTEEDATECQIVCKATFASCKTMMTGTVARYTSIEHCVLVRFAEHQSYPGQCQLTTEVQGGASHPQDTKCFPSSTRRRVASGEFPFIFQLPVSKRSAVSSDEPQNNSADATPSLVSMGTFAAPTSGVVNPLSPSWSASSTTAFIDSCECFDPDHEPCTAPEARDAAYNFLYPALTYPLCAATTSGEKAFFTRDELTGRADASTYFALKGMQRIHCPIPMYRALIEGKDSKVVNVVTFSKFESKEELNNFCEKGLEVWDRRASNSIRDGPIIPRCEAASSVTGDDNLNGVCQRRCIQSRTYCSARSETVTELASCVKDQLISLGFHETCTTPEVLAPGRGIIMCKRKLHNCVYTEWTEWSECSPSCFDWAEGLVPTRVRSRNLVADDDVNPEQCRNGSRQGTVQTEECTKVPVCHGSEDVDIEGIPVVEPKPEPVVPAWSDTRADAGEEVEERDGDHAATTAVKCFLANMSDLLYEAVRGYDEAYRACKCPQGRKPCTRAEAMATLDNWTKDVEAACERGRSGAIVLMDGDRFFCATGSFGKEQAPLSEAACGTSEYDYVLCEGDRPWEEHTVTRWIVCLLLGLTLGIAVVLCCLQYSGDLQKLVGLAGSYPRLVQELVALETREKENAKRGPEALDTWSLSSRSASLIGDLGRERAAAFSARVDSQATELLLGEEEGRGTASETQAERRDSAVSFMGGRPSSRGFSRPRRRSTQLGGASRTPRASLVASRGLGKLTGLGSGAQSIGSAERSPSTSRVFLEDLDTVGSLYSRAVLNDESETLTMLPHPRRRSEGSRSESIYPSGQANIEGRRRRTTLGARASGFLSGASSRKGSTGGREGEIKPSQGDARSKDSDDDAK